MIFRKVLFAAMAAFLAYAPAQATAQDQQPLSPAQTEAVRKLVRQYIMENPEIIAEAIEALREKQRLAAEAEARKALVERRNEILNDPDSPVAGNREGDVTLVEFFDYRCTYCKSVYEDLLSVVEADGKVRLIFKEFPILGPESNYAARAALAARAQNKYAEFHGALMRLRTPLNEKAVMKAAADVGLNAERLKKDMASPQIGEILKRNIDLARALDINGTPAFVIGDRIIPGALDKSTLKHLIEQTRKQKDKEKG
ncbi:MAG: DsbA family protein [Rhodospirillales bacterium]|nr:DsbA family protein [Rhodospirillales bacterium]